MSRLIDENTIIKMLNTMDRYTSEELTLCDTDETFPKNEVFIVDDVFEGLDELPSALPEPCEDAVSREVLKDGFTEMCNLICPYTKKQQHVMCGSCLMGTAFDVLEATPSVTPKQRTGKWIHVSEEMWKCDQCGEISCCSPKYCPDCGSRNEVSE